MNRGELTRVNYEVANACCVLLNLNYELLIKFKLIKNYLIAGVVGVVMCWYCYVDYSTH